MSVRRGARSRRSKPAGCLVLVLVAVLLVIVVIVAWYLLAGLPKKPGPGPEPPERPSSQPAHCPDVQMVSVPGTWESSSTDDPYHPSANPASLMLNITGPVQEQYPDEGRLDIYTVPYVAQFSNPIAFPPDGQQSYNNSRAEGLQRTLDFLSQRHDECPLTSYVLAGFSQGAVIAGDVAAQIGAGDGPVPADLVLGVTLLADGRRTGETGPGQAMPVGVSPPGVGAEVALAGLNVPGITMTGPRPGGFGELADRTYTICAPGDLICDAPRQALSPSNILGSLATLVQAAGNPVHSLYHGFVVDPNGTTATGWTVDWANGLVAGAPHPPHS
ncbi:cutinase [Nocardia donostiensis]|uniref:cutinase family protein n=1 Tax=Nocardia donostiensis TaxID=1538463 RepID=UPI0009DA327E|nr:cutinase family protein [Nocardia donostiensis]OQS14219.1 cutinase [Nocardia donostiensis]